MASTNRGLWIAMSVPIALVGSVIYFKWNADGPGTHGGGDDLHVTLEAPMAAPMQPPESDLSQRRHERASISGTVRDPDHRPIAGAHVCAAASSTLLGSDETRWPRCTRSDRDGHYQLGDLHGVRQRVSAGALGHLPADHTHLLAGVPRRAVDLRPGMVATVGPSELWITNSDDGKVVFNTTTLDKKTGEVATGAGAHGLVLSADGKTAYVTNQGADTVSVLDTAARMVKATLAVGKKPNGLVFRSR